MDSEKPQWVLRIIASFPSGYTINDDQYFMGRCHGLVANNTRWQNAVRYVSREVAELAAKEIVEQGFFKHFKGLENGRFRVGLYTPEPTNVYYKGEF